MISCLLSVIFAVRRILAELLVCLLLLISPMCLASMVGVVDFPILLLSLRLIVDESFPFFGRWADDGTLALFSLIDLLLSSSFCILSSSLSSNFSLSFLTPTLYILIELTVFLAGGWMVGLRWAIFVVFFFSVGLMIGLTLKVTG